eukprot:TRINITY_DN3641_c0_g3_i1.p2 TRINITY_DN3641_c0_g3~~TRINITY_DN3641_c0_g3_i1.p2  ORF type:complete len:313 (-),score=52.36 TRINITY_DN3641_c0_g3_i1:273-1211(-)
MLRQHKWWLPKWASTFPGGQLGCLTQLGKFGCDLERWWGFFARDQFAVIEVERLGDPQKLLWTLNQLLEGVSAMSTHETRELCSQVVHANATPKTGVHLQLTAKQQQHWCAVYEPHNHKLADMLGSDIVRGWSRSPAGEDRAAFESISQLSGSQLLQLREAMPRLLRSKMLKKIFDSDQDGYHLLNLERALSHDSATCSLLVVQDSQGKIFGGFAPRVWQQQRGFFGSGECFVFECAEDRHDSVKLHAWAPGREPHFMFCDSDYFGFGSKALRLDQQLHCGTSAPDEAYGNRTTLASSQVFTCRRVECLVPV